VTFDGSPTQAKSSDAEDCRNVNTFYSARIGWRNRGARNTARHYLIEALFSISALESGKNLLYGGFSIWHFSFANVHLAREKSCVRMA
jgi:hypothetical protein